MGEPVTITSSTQAGKVLPTPAPSESTSKDNVVPLKVTEPPSSSSASSMPKTTLPSTTISKQDTPKTKGPLPILAPLREKPASYKSIGKSDTKSGTALTGDQEPTTSSPRW